MSVSEQAEREYDKCASSYNDYGKTPSGLLESNLIQLALGDCTGLTVLDLGGGTGLHAREAIELGATRVDIVDISAEMLRVAQSIEKSLGREDIIRFHQADVTQSLSHLPLLEHGYDIVMGNWIFNYAGTMELLEGMFRNIAGNLKPGGRFIGVRDADPRSPALEDSRYGSTTTWVKDFPGGVKYHCVLKCEPPVEFETSSWEIIYSGSRTLYERFGMSDVRVIDPEGTEIVQEDPEFWRAFVERPFLAVTRAVYKSTRD